MNRNLLLIAAVAALSTGLLAQPSVWPPSPAHLTMAIWPGTPPGAKTSLPPETDMNAVKTKTMAGRPYIRLGNVSTPTITLYKPTGKNTGAAIVVFPGGGYQILSWTWKARRCATGSTRGRHLRAAEVSRARLAGLIPSPLPRCRTRSARWDWCGCTLPSGASIPNRVGVLGFSAGGHLVGGHQQPLRKAALRSDRRRRQAELPAGLLRWFCIPATWRWRTRTSRPIPTFIPRRTRRPRSSCRPRTIRFTWRIGGVLHAVEECQGAG